VKGRAGFTIGSDGWAEGVECQDNQKHTQVLSHLI